MPDTTRHPSAGGSAGRSATQTRGQGGRASHGSHLSIGEVLGLLLEEFPDVTISKIRFLESQGLIAPERNPSGYRKFFDEDVELLRVILREQRENYLPLRVIKDRIDSGEIDPSGEHTVPRGIRNVTTPDDREAAADPTDYENGAVAPADGRDRAESARTHGDATATAAAAGATDASADDAADSAHAGRAPDARPNPNVSDVDAAGDAGSTTGGIDDPAPAERPDSPTRTPPDAPAATTATSASPQTPSTTSPAMSGVTLTLDELSTMVGATLEEVRELQEYGIVSSRDSHGEQLYDDSAVEIVRIAVEFLRAGVDARHLRGWKTAADREASLYEQLIMPLLRQRNPHGRQQARDQVQHLNDLGGRLRSAMMRAALRDEFGG